MVLPQSRGGHSSGKVHRGDRNRDALAAELRKRGIASFVSGKGASTTPGAVFVDTVVRIEGVTATVFTFALRAKVGRAV
jgi:hypothetical protein